MFCFAFLLLICQMETYDNNKMTKKNMLIVEINGMYNTSGNGN